MKRNWQSFLMSLLLATAALIGCEQDDPEPGEYEKTEDGHTIVPRDFLSDELFDKLIVEIQYPAGYQPKTSSVDQMVAFLQQRLNKPAGIDVVMNEIESPGKSVYSLADIRSIESQNRTQKSGDGVLSAYFFFADGDYAESEGNSKVLGIAYGASSMVIFEKTIQDYSGGLAQPSTADLETTVVLHEFGHILGLVNNGTPLQTEHQDKEHGRHCDNEDCLMYYAAETTAILGSIIGGAVPELDNNCVADLQANGGK